MKPSTALLGVLLFLASCGEPQTSRLRVGGNEARNVPDEIVLICDSDGHRISTDEVRPQGDGVHLVVDNRRDRDPGIAYRYGDGSGGGDNAPPGRTVLRLPAPPGPFQVACYPNDPNAEPAYLSAEVVDPEGVYVDAELGCGARVSGIGEYTEKPKGVDDPEAAARDQLEFGIEEGDELRRAGYPDAEAPVFVVVRDGDVVARTDLLRGTSGWYTDGYEACEDFAG